MMLDAGTTFDAGCTPDGACWPAFTLSRPAYVRFVDEPIRGHLRGLCACGEGALLIVQRGGLPEGWTVEAIIAHEAGHLECVTVHRDGKRWCHE